MCCAARRRCGRKRRWDANPPAASTSATAALSPTLSLPVETGLPNDDAVAPLFTSADTSAVDALGEWTVPAPTAGPQSILLLLRLARTVLSPLLRRTEHSSAARAARVGSRPSHRGLALNSSRFIGDTTTTSLESRFDVTRCQELPRRWLTRTNRAATVTPTATGTPTTTA